MNRKRLTFEHNLLLFFVLSFSQILTHIHPPDNTVLPPVHQINLTILILPVLYLPFILYSKYLFLVLFPLICIRILRLQVHIHLLSRRLALNQPDYMTGSSLLGT